MSKDSGEGRGGSKSRREVWLLRQPLHSLPKNRLPCNGEIVKRYYYLNRNAERKNLSYEETDACERDKPGDLIYHGKVNSCKLSDGTVGNCIVRDIVIVWKKAGFQSQFLKGERYIKDQIVTLVKKFRRFRVRKTLDWKADTYNQKVF